MPQTRLQSDMIQNMGRSARAAMLQRGRIAANQQEWLDYVYARDAGAFYGDPYGGDSSGEHLIGQTNPYAKYYAAQHAKQLAFQRQRFLNAQSFQNNYMLQQQKFMLGQAAEEQKIARNKQEMERQLAFVHKELDALENNPEVDKNSWEYKARRQQLLDDEYKLQTGLNRNTLLVHEKPSGYKDENGDPIMSTFMIGPDDKPIFISEGKEIASINQKRAELEQKTKNDSAKLNLDKEKFDFEQQKHKDTLPIEKAKVANDQLKNKLTAAGQSQDDLKSKLGVADKLEEREAKRRAASKAAIEAEFERKVVAAGGRDIEMDTLAELMKERDEAISNIDFTPAKAYGIEPDPGSEYGVRSTGPIQSTREYIPERPTGLEAQDEIERRQMLGDPEATEEDLGRQVQYEGPMDPEFSDEQFAGTEPAGLYDPTGQPLSMDGGMYDGLI